MIIGKSTVTVGTSRDLGALFARLSPAGEDVEVVWNPEFLRKGHAIDDTLRPDRIVVGVPSARAEDVVRQVYAPLLADGIPLFVTDPATAELIKGAANAYLGMKISFINGVADMCAAAGADVQQLTEAIGADPRIGRGGLNAGPGYGSGCLPKDVRAFTASARTLGLAEAATMLRAAEEVNESRPTAALKLIEQTLGRPVDGVRVTVWGASFKAGTNDVRESPALAIAALMHQRGATVTVHDPHAVPTALRRNPELDYADTLDDSVQDTELIVLATEWPHFREADPKAIAPLVAAPVLIDLRNLIDADAWRMAGWTTPARTPRTGITEPIDRRSDVDTLWDNIEKLSAVCRAAGAHLPDEELKALQVGKVAEEAGEAMHALHGLKGLTTCDDAHTWSEVQNDLVGAVIAALLAMHYIDPAGARATFDEILHRRTRRGREATTSA
ncbi:nucleotide sugar dehydrogenase [Streptomyces sp. NPDC059616]|uniref:nucleotide sugar dehydrogenase n=1 Tax=Streptomyces sp. NPDC059616 TaxID=3346886 RepID=UPI0036ADBD9B